MTDEREVRSGNMLADRYELTVELARGAMGDVFVGLDHRTGSEVAIKVLRAEHLADEAMRRRFRREAAVLKALDHPAIVRLLDLGADGSGMVFLVTELVEARSLAERIADAPLDLAAATTLVTTLCDALGAAHRHGVLHGDLKPENVLWVRPIPRLVDFGASKVLGLDRLTATGEIAGTPAYMSPEVLMGRSDVDERIDVYGLGILTYEALSGRHPFTDSHVGRLMMKIDAGDRLPLDAVADVPPAIVEVVHKAMDRNRSARHSSVEELARAWTAAMEEQG